MTRKLCFLTIFFILTACAPVDTSSTAYPVPVTQIPFYASDTPAPFIVPVTDTPIIVPPPVTDTPTFIVPLPETETPTPFLPTARWWEVYFTDPLVTNNPNVIEGSVAAKLIEFINNAQTSIHIASFEFNLTPVAEALIEAKRMEVR